MSAVAKLAAALVRIDSINPSLIAGAAGEAEAARFVAGWCRKAGLEVEIVEPAPGRPSVVATARGRGGGRTLLLNAHLDTVGVAAMQDPFDARTEDGRLYGRGSYDMKGALAAAMLATADAAGLGLAGDVVLTAVADEEVASLGTEAVLERVTADAAIVCEPTELQVATGHRGFAGFEIETHGVAAHGSRPDLGVDAISNMGPILVRLSELDARLQAGSRHPLLGTGSLHASLIEGGQEFSSYPARCMITGERRTLPGETVADVERDLRALVAESTDAEVRMTVARDAFELDRSHELVQVVARASGAHEVVGLPFWADSALVSAAGIPTLLFGPAGAGAHAAVEWVDIESLERCRAVYLATARDLCR
jgi:acetylornithine deacetylase